MEKPVLDIVKQQETPKKTASVKLSPPKQEYPPSEFNPVETIEEPVYTKPKFPKATQEVAGYTMPDTEKINVDISDDLVVCDICNRKFLADRLDRHQEACSKSQKQRKVFDVKKARVQGTDMEKYQGKQQEQKPPKKNNWRAKHMAFIQLVRSARDGTTLPSSQLVDPNPDYVTCPHCARRFNEAAAERHMPHCKEKATAQARNQSQSKEALKKRISYKPPTPRKLKK
ncbi:hypothetical protein EDD86DRAFT_208313 [Gorgonomyces haynaldii]|nr:hypothetical protein EDD86DRAFT_208313 [Gorgonomyces haynaldii]